VEDIPSRVAFEATDDFAPGLALLDPALVIVRSARGDPPAGEHDAVERGVGLPVAATVEATELPASRGTLEGTDPRTKRRRTPCTLFLTVSPGLGTWTALVVMLLVQLGCWR
jgi:hypothetical protein